MSARSDYFTLAATVAREAAQSEPSSEDVARWQAEVDLEMRASDRAPIGVTQDRAGNPLVVCRDGTSWVLESRPAGPEVSDGRLLTWEMLPPLPGSQGDLAGVYWKEPRHNGRTA